MRKRRALEAIFDILLSRTIGCYEWREDYQQHQKDNDAQAEEAARAPAQFTKRIQERRAGSQMLIYSGVCS
jgi:hypothetical protein